MLEETCYLDGLLLSHLYGYFQSENREDIQSELVLRQKVVQRTKSAYRTGLE